MSWSLSNLVELRKKMEKSLVRHLKAAESPSSKVDLEG